MRNRKISITAIELADKREGKDKATHINYRGWRVSYEEINGREAFLTKRGVKEYIMFFDRQAKGEDIEHIQGLIDYIKDK